MRILQIQAKNVPEWARCFYDYEHGKLLIAYVKKTILVRAKIRVVKKESDWKNQNTEEQLIRPIQQEGLERNQDEQAMKLIYQNEEHIIIKSVQQTNQLFYEYHRINMNIAFLFLQMKLHELMNRLGTYEKWARKVSEHKEIYISLLFNIYYEGAMLQKMCEVNMMAQKKMQKKHTKNFETYQLTTPFFTKTRLKRSMNQLNTYFVRLQSLYLNVRQTYPKKDKSKPYQHIEENSLQQSIASYLFGLTNGMSIALLLFIILIYAQGNVNDQTPQFRRDFPVWRLLCYIILYIWIFALDIVVFQKYRINYQLVFNFKNMSPRSAFALALASVFSFIYMTFFIIYSLDLTKLINHTEQVVFYFPLIAWGIAIVYLLNPLPIFNFQGRIFFFKQVLKSFFSPFLKIQFNMIWIVDQFESLILPFSDLTYTFCYYINVDLNDPTDRVCDPYLYTTQYFGIIIYFIRMIQSIKVALYNQKFAYTREMFLAIRCALCIFFLIVSLLSKVQQNFVYLWLVLVIPLFVYTYYVDLKWDWGLGEPNSKYKFLRKQLAFQPIQYYTIMVVNLIFRMAWVLTLSENIIYRYIDHPTFYILGIAILQIVRRFFWNIIKVERQYVINSQYFQIKTDYKQKQALIYGQVQGVRLENQNDKNLYIIQGIRHQEELINLRQQLQKKRHIQKRIVEWTQSKTKELYKIQEKIDLMITKMQKMQQ